jgi:hypothetical protein
MTAAAEKKIDALLAEAGSISWGKDDHVLHAWGTRVQGVVLTIAGPNSPARQLLAQAQLIQILGPASFNQVKGAYMAALDALGLELAAPRWRPRQPQRHAGRGT